MAITDELGYSTTALGNTTLGPSITLDGAVMTPSQVDDAFREEMSQRAKAITRHVVKAAGTYAAARADHNQFWRCTGAVTINLAAASALSDGWCLWVRANGGAVTIDPSGVETIDGAATLVLADGQTALVICTGTAFFTMMAGAAGPAYTALDALTLQGTAISSATTTDIGAATGRLVHITGTTTITGLGTKAAGVERELVFDGILTFTHNATSLILPGSTNVTTAAGDVAVMVSEGSGNWRCVSYQRKSGQPLFLTPWVAYTPTFTGFGTVASVSVWSRRIGDTLHIRGKFTSGTSTAVEARMTMGFNGVDGGLTSDSTKVASIQLAGPVVVSVAASASFAMLVESGVAHVTFGQQSAGAAGLTKQNGNNTALAGTVVSFIAEIPINGW